MAIAMKMPKAIAIAMKIPKAIAMKIPKAIAMKSYLLLIEWIAESMLLMRCGCHGNGSF